MSWDHAGSLATPDSGVAVAGDGMPMVGWRWSVRIARSSPWLVDTTL